MERSLLLLSTGCGFTVSAVFGTGLAVFLAKICTLLILLICLILLLLAGKFQKVNPERPRSGGIRELFAEARERKGLNGAFLTLCGSLIFLALIAGGFGTGALFIYAAKVIYS